jgi:two-component system response regulator YesN
MFQLPYSLTKNYYFRLTVSILLLAILPILVTTIFAYYNVTSTMEKDVGESNLQYLNHTVNGMEIIANQLQNTSRQVVLNDSFQNFESFPNGWYYQNLMGSLKSEDLEANYWYNRNKSEAVQSFYMMKLTNEFVESIYFYDYFKNLIIVVESSGNVGEYSLDTFYDKGWEKMIGRGADLLSMKARQATAENGTNRSVLTTMIPTTVSRNAIIINLNQEKVYQKVLQKLNDRDELYVFSEGNDVVLLPENKDFESSGVKVIRELADKKMIDRNYQIASIESKNVLITRSESKLLRWIFISLADLNQVYKSVRSLKQIMVYSTTILVLLVLIASFVTSRNLYRPFFRTYLEKESLKNRLNQSLPFYQEKFKLSLLTNRFMSEGEIREKMEFLNIDFSLEHFAVILLSIDAHPDDQKGMDSKYQELFKIQMMEQLGDSVLGQTKHMIADVSDNQLAIVVHIQKNQFDSIFELVQKVIEMLQLSLGGSFSAGVGRYCPDTSELPRGYDEAKEALQYRMLFGSGQVIYINDVTMDQSVSYIFTKDKEEALIGFIKLGSEDKAKELLHQIVRDIQDRRMNMHYNHVQSIFAQMISSVLSMTQSMGINPGMLFIGNPYEILHNKKLLAEIEDWFGDIIEKSTKILGKELEFQENNHVRSIKEKLESNLNSELSLNSVSSTLQLNPVYVGRLFKQTTGKSFVEYLTELRVDKSKELLTTSNLTVNEVSWQVGYKNAYYFIKVFKEHTGMTPGEYRKIRRE